MQSLSGIPLPPPSPRSSTAELYLAAILEELQWQRKSRTPITVHAMDAESMKLFLQNNPLDQKLASQASLPKR
jgi:hypothetical protein